MPGPVPGMMQNGSVASVSQKSRYAVPATQWIPAFAGLTEAIEPLSASRYSRIRAAARRPSAAVTSKWYCFSLAATVSGNCSCWAVSRRWENS